MLYNKKLKQKKIFFKDFQIKKQIKIKKRKT